MSIGAPVASAVPHQQFIDPPWRGADVLTLAVAAEPPAPHPGSAKVATAASRPATPKTYRVVPGDSLSSIAARFHVDVMLLAEVNHMQLWYTLYAGRVLALPAPGQKPTRLLSWTPPYTPPPVTSVVTSHITSEPTTYVHSSAPVSYSAPAPAPVASSSGSGTWGCIAHYESGGNPATNTGNGFYGMYQDTQQTWAAYGGLSYASRADLATAAEQLQVNERVQAGSGWGAWPITSVMCGA